MNVDSWWQEVEKTIEVHSLLRHPFYQAWQAGELSLADLTFYAKQYYPHVAAFPRYVSAIHSNTPELGVRQMLLENLMEEERGENNHPELWLRFAEGVGASRASVQETAPLPETVSCVDGFMDLARSAKPWIGLGALYAYERQIPAVSSTKMQGLREFYGVSDDRSHQFFRVHEKADVWHSQVEKEALLAYGSTPERRGEILAGVESACRLVWRLLDGVVRERRG